MRTSTELRDKSRRYGLAHVLCSGAIYRANMLYGAACTTTQQLSTCLSPSDSLTPY